MYRRMTVLDKYRISGFIVKNPSFTTKELASYFDVSVSVITPYQQVVDMYDPAGKHPLTKKLIERLPQDIGIAVLTAFNEVRQNKIIEQLEAGVPASRLATQFGGSPTSMRLFSALYEWAFKTVTNRSDDWLPQTRRQWEIAENRVREHIQRNLFPVDDSILVSSEEIAQELVLPVLYVKAIRDCVPEGDLIKLDPSLYQSHGAVHKHETVLSPAQIDNIRTELIGLTSLDATAGDIRKQFKDILKRWEITDYRAQAIFGDTIPFLDFSNVCPKSAPNEKPLSSLPDPAKPVSFSTTVSIVKKDQSYGDTLPPARLLEIEGPVLHKLGDIEKKIDTISETIKDRPVYEGPESADGLFGSDLEIPEGVKPWLSLSAMMLLSRVVRGEDFDLSLSGYRSAITELETYDLIAVDRSYSINGKALDPMVPRLPNSSSLKSSTWVKATQKGLSLWASIREVANALKLIYCREVCGTLGVILNPDLYRDSSKLDVG